MTTSGLTTVDDRSFPSLVIERQQPALVLFTALNCLPCRLMARWLPTLAREFDGALEVVCCSVEASPLIARRYGISAVPTLVLFSGGTPLAAHGGLWPLPAVATWVSTLLPALAEPRHGGPMTNLNISKETIATTGVIGAALLAASCCLAPVLFIIFGISAGALTKLGVLEPYRPAFIAAGSLCLAAAGWWIYGRRGRSAAACADDQCVVDSPRQRRTRLLFWISAGAFAVAIIYPYALSLYLNHGGF